MKNFISVFAQYQKFSPGFRFRFNNKFPNSFTFKVMEMFWGCTVFVFAQRLHASIQNSLNNESIKFDLYEFWDCINDGWMRQYIYPYDNMFSSVPSPERILRLGSNSFRGYIDMSNPNNITMQFDNSLELDMNDVIQFKNENEYFNADSNEQEEYWV